MRRTIALSLLMIFSWMLSAPFFAPDAEASLPACCRRHGKHHCMMRMMGRIYSNQKGFTTVTEKCPYQTASTNAAHSPTPAPEAGKHFYAEVVRHPACAPQMVARFSISFHRAHQKRGPPTPLA
jgi:hypothetical protein